MTKARLYRHWTSGVARAKHWVPEYAAEAREVVRWLESEGLKASDDPAHDVLVVLNPGFDMTVPPGHWVLVQREGDSVTCWHLSADQFYREWELA